MEIYKNCRLPNRLDSMERKY